MIHSVLIDGGSFEMSGLKCCGLLGGLIGSCIFGLIDLILVENLLSNSLLYC